MQPVAALDHHRRLLLPAALLRERVPEVRAVELGERGGVHARKLAPRPVRTPARRRHTGRRMGNRRRLPLELLVFVVGAATLGAEIAAARLIAPYFGDSTIVWANTIAVVLVALSVGYWFGGRLADRHPHLDGLCMLVLASSVLLAVVPFVAQPLLSLSVDAFDDVSLSGFAGSLFGVLALVAIPVLMLGAVSPWAIRLKLVSASRTPARPRAGCTRSRRSARWSGRSAPRCC